MARYYVDEEMVYPYVNRNAMIKRVIKAYGGTNVRLANKFGWSNQPKVMCFNANSKDVAMRIEERLIKSLKHWCMVKVKDW